MYICAKEMEKQHCLWLVILLAERSYHHSLLLFRTRVKTVYRAYKHFCVWTYKSNVQQCANKLLYRRLFFFYVSKLSVSIKTV